MENIVESNKPNHISFSHVALVFLCVVALVFLTYVKSGFKLNILSQNTSSEKNKTLSYEQALSQAAAEINGGELPSEQTADDGQQVAMLDPLSNEGKVLGASTEEGDGVFPNAEEFLTPEIMNSIKLNISPVSDYDSISKYKRDLHAVESSNMAEEILSALSNDNQEALKTIEPKVQQLVVDLYSMEVPKGVEEYHKVKMIYYLDLSQLALGYAGDKTVADPKDTSVEIFSLFEKLQRLSQDISTNYGVQL